MINHKFADKNQRASMQHRITMAVVCLHISALLYLILAALLPFLVSYFDEEEIGVAFVIGFASFCVALSVGIEVVVYGLRHRKFWAWVAGVCIFGLYIPSLFLPLGALGLWGLFDEGSRAQFGVNSSKGRVD